MPGMDGVEATRRIAARDPSRPKVLILTTFDLDEYVFAGLRAGRQRLPAQGRPARRAARRRSGPWPSGDAIVAPAITRRLLDRFAEQPHADQPAAPSGIDRSPSASARCCSSWRAGLSNAEIAARLSCPRPP